MTAGRDEARFAPARGFGSLAGREEASRGKGPAPTGLPHGPRVAPAFPDSPSMARSGNRHRAWRPPCGRPVDPRGPETVNGQAGAAA